MRRAGFLPILALAALSGCATFQGAHPSGFAPYPGNGGKLYRAASPDGLVWRIRSERHRPEADLAFWKRALRDRIQGAGYAVADSLEFRMGDRPAFALETGLDDQAWLVAIAPGPRRIVVAEVAGPLEAFQKHRGEILQALERIQPR